MDIFKAWRSCLGQNAGVILAFTIQLVRQYWKIMEQPVDHAALDAYRGKAMSGNYNHLISESAEFILEQTGIQVPCEYLLRDIPEDDDQ